MGTRPDGSLSTHVQFCRARGALHSRLDSLDTLA